MKENFGFPSDEFFVSNEIKSFCESLINKKQEKYNAWNQDFEKFKRTSKYEEFKTYKQMEKDALISLDSADITALSAATVSNKLLQLANGAIYDEEKETHVVHSRKLDALHELVEESQNENMLIFC